MAASDAVVFGATPPLECKLSLKVVSNHHVVLISHATCADTKHEWSLPQIAGQRRATTGYRLHWLNKYDNAWIPLCSEHTVDDVAGDVSASLSAQVQDDPRFNPISPDKCHDKLKSCKILPPLL